MFLILLLLPFWGHADELNIDSLQGAEVIVNPYEDINYNEINVYSFDNDENSDIQLVNDEELYSIIYAIRNNLYDY